MDLELLEQRFATVARERTAHADQELAIIACEEAFDAAREGNYGVGAVLVDPDGAVVERGHNTAFQPSFRSDLHAEMVVMNAFERRCQVPTMQGYTLLCSLEPCPMCLSRLLIAGVQTVKFIAHDELGGMVTHMRHLPQAWKKLSERVDFQLADASDELRTLASEVFVLNLDRLRRKLWAR